MNLAIVGATASGKTAIAVDIARRLGDCDLISVDAMAVYRDMDIGTAKPTLSEREGVTWRLLDVTPPSAEFSVAQFQQAALEAVEATVRDGRSPILVGGTGLYHRAVIDRLELPPQFPEIRAALESEAESGGGAVALHQRLSSVDPVAAERMEPANLRRVVRALEVTIGSGRPFSSFGPGLLSYPASSWQMVGLAVDRDELDRRIATRLGRQLAGGFIDEVIALRARPGGLSRTARQALGYRELIEHLDGRRRLDATVEEILRRTRSFARRQLSWFGRDPRIVWVDANRPDLAEKVLAAAASRT